jgi:hypothetical protein
MNLEFLISEFKKELPKVVNERATIEQVFGDNTSVWIICKSPERSTPEEDYKLLQFLISEMKNTSFVKELLLTETRIHLQIIAENQQNIAAGEIKELNEFLFEQMTFI